MSWVAVAVVGSAAVGAYSADKASKAASKASSAEIGFAREQYQDWMDSFGDIQSNLADYYENLTPAFIETQGLQAFEQEKTMALEGLRTTLEQRGIATSGLAQEIETDVALQSASERAKIRANAPLEAAKAQREFLQIGLGQNPASSVQDALAARATSAQNRANTAGAQFASTASAAADTTFSLLEKHFNKPQIPDVDASIGSTQLA